MNSKQIKLLKTLSENELKMFNKFIKSPYFNTVKNLCALYNELIKFHPSYSSEQLSYEMLHKKIFGEKPYNRQVMWNLSSQLEGKLKQFFLHQELKSNPVTELEQFLNSVVKRKQVKLFKENLGKLEGVLKQKKIDYDYFENRMHLENYKQDYFHLTDNIRKMGDSKLQASEYLILLFLRMAAGSLNDLKLLENNHNYRPKSILVYDLIQKIDLVSFIENCKSVEFEYTFLIETYYHSIMLLLDPGKSEHLFRLKKLFDANYNKFAAGEKRSIMHWIANYCFENLDADENRYRQIAFEINKLRLKEGLVFYPENQLPSAMFLQILNNAIALNKFEWTINFIKTYSDYLNPELREQLNALGNAIVSFGTGEYRKTLSWLSKADVTEIQYKFYVRTLSARCYYELGEEEALLSYIDASLHFLRINKLVTKQGRIYLQNFFNFLRQIQKIKDKGDLIAAKQLRANINSTSEISNKKWLLEKIDVLEKSFK